MWCPNRRHVCFPGLEYLSMNEYLYIYIYIRSSKSRNAILTANMANSLTGRFEQPHGFKTCQNCFGVVTVSEMPKIFSEFSPLCRVLRAGWSGRVLRCNTAACSSRERPQRNRPAAPRGQSRRGCQGRRWPWPRTRI